MHCSTKVFFAFFVLSLCSCQEDPPLKEPGSNEAINQWTMDQMRHYYYWQDKIKPKPDYQQEPYIFFNSILFQADHFSSILQTLNSDTYGNTLVNTFGFDMVQLQTATGTIQLVTQVVPFSDADLMGLRRGDSLTHLNSWPMNNSNMRALLKESLHLPKLQLTRMDGKSFSLPSSYISQPVVYSAKIIAAAPKVGYIFLSQLDFSGAYSLLETIRDFKARNIDELIVDLRYNPGGQVAFASFCALLFADIREDAIFAKYRGNKNLKNREDSFTTALQRQPEGYSFVAKELLKQGLQLKRLYVLTGPNTASAAEMLINGLRPYIDIVQIGDKTYGKDMASITISSPEQVHGTQRTWHLMPMVYKIYNTADQGDYNNGIAPPKVTNEFAHLPLLPLGDTQDPLIQEVLQTVSFKAPQSKSTIDIPEKTTLLPKHLASSYQITPIEISVD
ncbi:S41 family peptidase [Sphingobacterium sp. InxBP1]|uniref:S41 family peptidase n=1 Tax=Sphingobacterium sp. InxBP1 TaxID=2870328 RepID=UPI00224461FF|nr:S41 family peptidase [Sphingobacterium sp. InxBP1]